jgi:hypothetical protein
MRKYLPLGALALTAGVAHADPMLGLYAGAGVTSNTVNNVLNTGMDLSNKEWKAFAGIKPAGSPLGFEAEYLSLGAADTGLGPFAHTQGKTYAFDAVGHIPLPVPFLSVIAKAGVDRWNVTSSGGGFPGVFPQDRQAYQFTWGAGAQAHFGSLGARLEYEHFNIANTAGGAKVVTLGVLFTFL